MNGGQVPSLFPPEAPNLSTIPTYPSNTPHHSLLALALSLQARLEKFRRLQKISLSGHGLDIAAVTAIARFVNSLRAKSITKTFI
jgi:hypothetical protein